MSDLCVYVVQVSWDYDGKDAVQYLVEKSVDMVTRQVAARFADTIRGDDKDKVVRAYVNRCMLS